jgi:inner membrane protein
MTELFPVVGPWFWFVAAGLLLIGELVAPGVFLLWLAVAAALTGLIDLVLQLGWQGEIAVFAVTAFFSVLFSWKFVMGRRPKSTDQPHLNDRLQGFVGKNFALAVAITHGQGKIRIEDAMWDVVGPDLPTGTMVRVTGVDGMVLQVQQLD